MTRFSASFGQPHRLGLVDPLAELADVDGGARLRHLPREVVLPVLAEHEVRGVEPHLPELERIGDASHERPEDLIHSELGRPSTVPPG